GRDRACCLGAGGDVIDIAGRPPVNLVSRFQSSQDLATPSDANFGIEGTSKSMILVSFGSEIRSNDSRPEWSEFLSYDTSAATWTLQHAGDGPPTHRRAADARRHARSATVRTAGPRPRIRLRRLPPSPATRVR